MLYIVTQEHEDGTFWEDPVAFDTMDEAVVYAHLDRAYPEGVECVVYECRQVRFGEEAGKP